MELNRAQLLVHDDAALAQFCTAHNILNDVLIKRPGPNKDVDWVEGDGNCIPVQTWLIHQPRTEIPLESTVERGYVFMLPHFHASLGKFCPNHAGSGCYDKEVDDLDRFSFLRFRGYVPARFNTRFGRMSDHCAIAIEVVNNCVQTRKVVKLLNYIPSDSDIARLREKDEGLNIGSSGLNSSDSFNLDDDDEKEEAASVVGDEEGDVKVEEGEEFPKVAPATKDLIEHSFNLGDSSGSSSEEVDMAPRIRSLGKKVAGAELDQQALNFILVIPNPAPEVHAPEFWYPKFVAIKLGKQVTNADSSRDYETCLALGNAIMLPQEMLLICLGGGSEEFKDKLIMQGILVCCPARAHTLESELKESRLDVASAELIAIQARNEAVASLAQLNKAFQENAELMRVASKEFFQKGFNEEEYMNQPANKEVVAAVKLGGGREDANVDVRQGNELN
ncbi:hypothetical protein Acr_07g0013660 [Actinidia rufa]|uniref:Uncharacterized protein n=1 Tax=Actinidia rufa TaxID=165716 RepID=A0A7J0EXM8_9ERIC|nr:hypothetical protein Acr_07g0013660 [Actinidia rufa]